MRGWVAAFAGGVLVAGLGVFLVVQGLDNADKWASVFGLLVGLAGLGVAVFGAVGARPATGGQSVADSVVGGGVHQVRGVGGNVHVGPAAAPAGSPATPPAAAPPSPAPAVGSPQAGGDGGSGQSVTRSWNAGPVHQISDVGGDVELDR